MEGIPEALQIAGPNRDSDWTSLEQAERLLGSPRREVSIEGQLAATELSDGARSKILHALMGGGHLAIPVRGLMEDRDHHQNVLVALDERQILFSRAVNRTLTGYGAALGIVALASILALGLSLGVSLLLGSLLVLSPGPAP